MFFLFFCLLSNIAAGFRSQQFQHCHRGLITEWHPTHQWTSPFKLAPIFCNFLEIHRHITITGSKGGAVVRALASHQCGPGSTPGVDAICGLSFLLVLFLAPRGFSPGTPVFPSPQKLTLPNSNSIWNALTRLNEFIWTPMCFVGKQAISNHCFIRSKITTIVQGLVWSCVVLGIG